MRPWYLHIKYILSLLFLLNGIGGGTTGLFAQAGAWDTDSTLSKKIEQYKEEAQSLVFFVEYMFNVLGDPAASTSEKQVIINDSYQKVFRDAKVQIEDDLVENRKVVTNKDVQAYLKDINFFFKKARFEFAIDQISHQVNEDNQLFFQVALTRILKGTTIEGDTISNILPRFMEVNLDEEEKMLKIVSIYTTKMSEQEELASWWNEMPKEWKSLFASQIRVNEVMTMEEVLEADATSGVFDTLTLNGIDTLHGEDTLILNNPLIFSSLRTLANLEEIDLSGRTRLLNLDPLSKLTRLKRLDISHTQITDLTPLRNLTHLEVLDCSYGAIKDFSPLKYAVNLRELICNHSQLRDLSSLENFPKLEKLHLHHSQVSNLIPLAKLTYLKDLRLSHTPVQELTPLASLSRLEVLYIDHTLIKSIFSLQGLKALQQIHVDYTMVEDLGPLAGLPDLRVLSANNTRINDLTPLNQLKHLNQVYCDNTLINKEKASNLMHVNTGALVVYQSTALQRWWTMLTPNWQVILRQYVPLDVEPSKEQLQALVNIDTLDLNGHKEITSLEPLKEFRNLHVLFCNGTGIKGLGAIRDLLDLEVLECEHTEVNSLAPLMQLQNLRYLNCAYTLVGDLNALKGLSSLERANFDGTLVNRLGPLMGLKRLRQVYVDSTGIDEVEAVQMIKENPNCLLIFRTEILGEWWRDLSSAWKEVFRAHVPAAEPPDRESLHRMTSLPALSVVDQKEIRDLSPLQILLYPRELKISNTRVQSLAPVSMLTSLEKLDCSRNAISDLNPVRNLFALRFLDCENTPIEDLSPLELLITLEEIRISGTQVKDIKPLKGLVYLRRLDCSNTHVKSLNPIHGLNHLTSLRCYNTRIPPAKAQKFREDNPDIDLVYY